MKRGGEEEMGVVTTGQYKGSLWPWNLLYLGCGVDTGVYTSDTLYRINTHTQISKLKLGKSK